MATLDYGGCGADHRWVDEVERLERSKVTRRLAIRGLEST